MPRPESALARRPAAPSASDLAHCRSLLAQGSKTFSFASRLLPSNVRPDAAVFYAFCRVADDAVDDSGDPDRAVIALGRRLDGVFAGLPADDPVDRALAAVVSRRGLPRAPFDALIDGFCWDAQGRDYENLASLRGYAARVASSVGVVMTLLMGIRDRDTLARACDLGVAMQLTNIARDVGEDARRGRLYLPRAWMREEGLDPIRFLDDPTHTPALRRVVARLLDEAALLYRRADPGVGHLPLRCRPAIRAASRIYEAIGEVLRGRDCNSVDARAYVPLGRKLLLLAGALWPRGIDDPSGVPLVEAQFLIEGVG